MMGDGSNGHYNYGGFSNLSALAPPFTVQKPLVDLTEPTSNWTASNFRPAYFSVPTPEFNSDAYSIYSTSVVHSPAPSSSAVPISNDSVLYGGGPASVLTTKPYYPSYGVSNDDFPQGINHWSVFVTSSSSSPVTAVGSSHEDCYTQNLPNQWNGTWDGFANWHQTKQVPSDGSFCSTRTYLNKDMHVSDSRSKYEASHSSDAISGDTQTEPVLEAQLEPKPVLGDKRKFVPVDPTSSTFAAPAPAPETYLQLPSIKAVNYRHCQMAQSASYEKFSMRPNPRSSETGKAVNSSPVSVIKPPAHDAGSFLNSTSNSGSEMKDLSSNSASVPMDSHIFGTKIGNGFYDPSHVNFHLINDPVIGDFSSAEKEDLSGTERIFLDALKHYSGTKPEVSCSSVDGLSFYETINPVRIYSECLDHYNPAVDSPCWKGSPASNFSQLEVREVVAPQNMKSSEACSSPRHQGHQTFSISSNDALKISPVKTRKKPTQHDVLNLENHLAPSRKSPSVGEVFHSAGLDSNLDVANHTKSTLFHQAQISEDAFSNKSFEKSDSKLPQNKKQSFEGGKWTADSNCAPVVGVADAGMIVNDDPDGCSSQVPFCAIEHVLCSPPSADNASIMQKKAGGEASTQNACVKTLIDTMQNLSELVVFHFSNDMSEMKDDDSEALRDVISNLESCFSKKAERTSSSHASTIPEKATSKIPGKSVELQKEEDEISPAKKDEKLSAYISDRAAADALKDDNVTQAIKKVLIENFCDEEETEPQARFYKNLWLETEASLCYTGCMSRFLRMKSEMEKCDTQQIDGLPEKSVSQEKLSRSNSDSDSYTSDVLTSKSSPLPNTSVPMSSILSSGSHPDDVAARFDILRCRVESSSVMNDASVDKLLGSPDKMCNSGVLDNIENVPSEEKDVPEPAIAAPDFPVLCNLRHYDDVEASVMARFNILKGRVDNSTFAERDEVQTGSIDHGGVRSWSLWPTSPDGLEESILDVNIEPHSHSVDLKFADNKLPVKADPVKAAHNVKNLGDKSEAGFGDGSSDWEHVLLEELVSRNSYYGTS